MDEILIKSIFKNNNKLFKENIGNNINKIIEKNEYLKNKNSIFKIPTNLLCIASFCGNIEIIDYLIFNDINLNYLDSKII